MIKNVLAIKHCSIFKKIGKTRLRQHFPANCSQLFQKQRGLQRGGKQRATRVYAISKHARDIQQ
jgi:hypothetical protein